MCVPTESKLIFKLPEIKVSEDSKEEVKAAVVSLTDTTASNDTETVTDELHLLKR